MALYVSTGARQDILKGNNFRDMFNRNTSVLKIYSGAAPATADAAATGTLLVTITNASGATGNKQKVRFSTIAANNETYTINLNGHDTKVLSDASGSLAEITTAFKEMLDNLCGAGGATFSVETNVTPCVGTYVINGLSSRFAAATIDTVNGYVDVEANTLGQCFDYACSSTPAGSKISAAVSVDDNGLRFEAASDVASGIIEKLSTQTWSGVAAATGTAGYFRLVYYTDDGTLSTSQVRLQGTVNTSSADLNMSKVNVVSGETHTIDTFQITMPAS